MTCGGIWCPIGGYTGAPTTVDGAVPSLVVAGYAWITVGDLLRLRDEATGRLVPTTKEALLAAEEEVARLRAELERLRGVPPSP